MIVSVALRGYGTRRRAGASERASKEERERSTSKNKKFSVWPSKIVESVQLCIKTLCSPVLMTRERIYICVAVFCFHQNSTSWKVLRNGSRRGTFTASLSGPVIFKESFNFLPNYAFAQIPSRSRKKEDVSSYLYHLKRLRVPAHPNPVLPAKLLPGCAHPPTEG